MIALRLQLAADARADGLGAHDRARCSAPNFCVERRLDLVGDASRRRASAARRRARPARGSVNSRVDAELLDLGALDARRVDASARMSPTSGGCANCSCISVPPVNSML